MIQCSISCPNSHQDFTEDAVVCVCVCVCLTDKKKMIPEKKKLFLNV